MGRCAFMARTSGEMRSGSAERVRMPMVHRRRPARGTLRRRA